jgi:hypothetical protein
MVFARNTNYFGSERNRRCAVGRSEQAKAFRQNNSKECQMVRCRLEALILIVAMLSVAFHSSANSQTAVEIRLVVDSPSPSAVRMSDDLTHVQSNLSSNVLFALQDLLSVTATPDSLNPLRPSTLTLRFKPTLTDSLRRYSSAMIGRQVALVIDGRIIGTARIVGAFTEAAIPIRFPTYKYGSTIDLMINAALKKQ